MKIATAIFFILYGLICIIFGFLNKKHDFWMTIPNTGLEKLLGEKFTPIFNILIGLITLGCGLLMIL